MTQLYEFDIKPMAKQSVRLGNGFHYQPAPVVNYHNALQFMARQIQLNHKYEKFTTAIRVNIVAIFAHPKSMKAADKQYIANGFSLPKCTKPDIDNLVKATLDPLNGLLWTDDALICELRAAKRWGTVNKLIISVEEAE